MTLEELEREVYRLAEEFTQAEDQATVALNDYRLADRRTKEAWKAYEETRKQYETLKSKQDLTPVGEPDTKDP